ncbi:hypothetical protein TELCIR_01597 [Teladorsagia circumcincta]|uniref:Peptidase family M1 n=1 Tax=Teladorsagia circumcincta TaxID=45464 RepID=A0A2G9V1G0_TELCI|nr:hypothetical protein TELCIR_01597 [Teladorsagia circumcincta]
MSSVTEVYEAFDAITYSKGASVLTMMHALIGEENFKRAVTQYLKKFSYENAKASDLWGVFDEAVKDVKGPDGNPMKTTEFAYQWTTQMGYPVVTVEAFNATSLKVTQNRYKPNKDALEPEKYRHPKYGFKWDIPLWYQEGENKEIKQTWLSRDKPLYLHVSTSDASIVVNADRHGFYRQNYDVNAWRKIIRQLKDNHEVYSPRTRNAIISDAFAAALLDGGLKYEAVFELLEYAKNEEEYLPWDEIISGFYSILEFFGNEPESKWAKKAVIDAYCRLGSKDCIGKYKELFVKEVMEKCKDGEEASKCVSVAAPLRSRVYCYGVKEGGDEAFDKVIWYIHWRNMEVILSFLAAGVATT